MITEFLSLLNNLMFFLNFHAIISILTTKREKIMTLKIYCAVKASVENKTGKSLLSGHITLSFLEMTETDKLFPGQIFPSDKKLSGFVSGIEYWKHKNLTVLLVESPDLHIAQKQLSEVGFTYNQYDFLPHITIGAGDLTEQYSSMIGESVSFSDFYIRIKDFN